MSPAAHALFGTDLPDLHITLEGVLKVTGPVLLGACTLTWWIAKRFYRGRIRSQERHIDVLQNQVTHVQDDRRDDQKAIGRLRKDVEAAREGVTTRDTAITELKKKLVPFYHHYTKLKPEYDRAVKELAAERELVKKWTDEAGNTDGQLRVVREELDKREQELNRTERRIRRALRLEGNLWMVNALQKVPKFRPLADRNRAVISVLNLKGGVGKTTVTAQLGIALARRGYKVLLVDLDLQGSLSSLFLPFDKIEQLSADERLLQHFLKAAAADQTVKLMDYVQPVFEAPESGGRLGLVATSDHLAYAELSLTLQWLLRQGERDTRFLLRKALHLKSVTREYDIVLLDCPPLINISCVNALAASDYVLAPVTLTRRAMERVPVLIGRYLRDQTFLSNINHDLKILGVLANRTSRDRLTGTEEASCDQLGTWCQDVAGLEVKRFQTVIPQQNKDLRDAETDGSLPDPESKLAQVFAALAGEIELELPNGCRRSSTAPVGPGRAAPTGEGE